MDQTNRNCQDDSSPGPSKTSVAPRRLWTPAEDDALIAAVQCYGSARGANSKWSQISAAVGPHRTNKDCRKRWFHSLDPNLRKGKWLKSEDDALRRLYAELGPQWSEIALRIPGRKDDQCSKRWRDQLDPALTPTRSWSSDEDALLVRLYELHGPKWTLIASQMPGRSPIACRNRGRKHFTETPAQFSTVPERSKTDFSTIASSSRGSQPSSDSDDSDWALPDFSIDDVLAPSVEPVEAIAEQQNSRQISTSFMTNSSAQRPETWPSNYNHAEFSTWMAGMFGAEPSSDFSETHTASSMLNAHTLTSTLPAESHVPSTLMSWPLESQTFMLDRSSMGVSRPELTISNDLISNDLQSHGNNTTWPSSYLPISNVNDLVNALERGETSLHVEANLLRSLVLGSGLRLSLPN